MSAPAPAVERAARALAEANGWSDLELTELGPEVDKVQFVLTAALTDPADPDSLARTLWYLHRTASGWGTALAAFEFVTTTEERTHWRAVADGLRMMLTGSGS